MKYQPRVETCLGILDMLAKGTASHNFESFGIQEAEFDMLLGKNLWLQPHRKGMEDCLNAIVYGAQEAIGVTRFPVSAEYMGAVIAMFVHPVNYLTACDWYARCQTSAAMSNGDDALGHETVSPGRLFAIVCELRSHNPAQYLAQYKKRVGLRDAKPELVMEKSK